MAIRKHVTKMMRVALAIFAVALAFCVWPVSRSADPRVRAQEWIEENQGHLPTTLKEIRLYPDAYQDAIYQALSPIQRLALWRDHLAQAAEAEVLRPEQREFVRTVANALNVGDFEPAGDVRAQLQQLLRQRHAIMGSQAALISKDAWKRVPSATQLFSAGLVRGTRALRVRIAEDLLSMTSVSALTPTCNCWVFEQGDYDCGCRNCDFCCPNTPTPPYVCNHPLYQSCGFLKMRPCDGLCCVCNRGSDICDDPPCPNTPIIVSTTGQYRLTDPAGGVLFDLDADGLAEQVAWTAPDSDDAFLALDRNGNGMIDNGTELFGNVTPIYADAIDPPSRHGFFALKYLEGPSYGTSDIDGILDDRDAAWAGLLLWTDRNHDGTSNPDELTRLNDAGFISISTYFRQAGRRDKFGNEFRLTSDGVREDGNGAPQRVVLYDVWLQAAR